MQAQTQTQTQPTRCLQLAGQGKSPLQVCRRLGCCACCHRDKFLRRLFSSTQTDRVRWAPPVRLSAPLLARLQIALAILARPARPFAPFAPFARRDLETCQLRNGSRRSGSSSAPAQANRLGATTCRSLHESRIERSSLARLWPLDSLLPCVLQPLAGPGALIVIVAVLRAA